ncbi:MAG TPA: DUF6311 domain-containing protein, partial [Devosia sp.]|nr:DUF6311 domain-containing protein [Devosia sp.]
LIPTNIAWLDAGDRAMHQLGWMFYREAPWGIPPGSSPLLGIELANSIALVDGLPLFAIPFKLIEAWLPEPFQYWGYWLLMSFILQSVFAWRIAREMEASRMVALVAAAFALITPAFLYRVPMHLALSGHWTILAALFLYVRREPPRIWMWPLLVGVTCAIHATLLAMVLAIWAAALLQRLWTRRIRFLRLLFEFMLGIVVALGVLWAVGFFGTESYGAYGYGSYKLNLAWPILTYAWSEIFPDFIHGRFDYEGLSFLGIGILALLIVSILTGAIAQLRFAFSRHWLPLTLMVLALMVFAFSKNLSIFNTDLVKLDVPDFVDEIGAAFRSTGRFVWPLLYMITIGTVVMVGRRFRALLAVPIIAVAFTAQAVDSAPEWRLFESRLPAPSSTWRNHLQSPLWERAAAAGYNRIRSIPVEEGYGSDWRALGYFAVTHGMDVDTAYLARVDGPKLAALRAKQEQVLVDGNFEPRTIYVLDVRTSLMAAKQAGPDDLITMVDGRIVFLPGGQDLAEGIDRWPGGG